MRKGAIRLRLMFAIRRLMNNHIQLMLTFMLVRWVEVC